MNNINYYSNNNDMQGAPVTETTKRKRDDLPTQQHKRIQQIDLREEPAFNPLTNKRKSEVIDQLATQNVSKAVKVNDLQDPTQHELDGYALLRNNETYIDVIGQLFAGVIISGIKNIFQNN